MYFFHRPFQTCRKTLAVLLVGTLLMVQALGLLHGVLHAAGAGGMSTASAVLATKPATAFASRLEILLGADEAGEHGSHHSCLAFDALAAPAALHTPLFASALLETQHEVALWLAFSSWHAPFRQHFSSRAPPLN